MVTEQHQHSGFTALNTAVRNLSWAVVDAQPEGEVGHPLTDRYESYSRRLEGHLRTIGHDLNKVLSAHAERPHQATGESLMSCQTELARMMLVYSAELVSEDNVVSLLAVMRSGDRRWKEWAVGVKDALDHLLEPLFDLQQEMIERVNNLIAQLARNWIPTATR